MTGFSLQWRRRYGLLLLIAIVALTNKMLQETGQPLLPASGSSVQADYIFEDFTAIRLDQEGQPLQEIRADEMIHFADAGLALLAQPLLIDPQRHWRVKAQTGVLVDSLQFARLQGQVHFRRQAPQRQPLSLFSEILDIRFADERVETDEAVRIEQGSAVTDAMGMRLELDQQRLFLLADVRSRYVPPGH